MIVKGNCGGQIPIDPNAFEINNKGELTMSKGSQQAIPFKNITVEGDAVINHLDVTGSAVVPDPSDDKDIANKKYVDAHYIKSPNGTLFKIQVTNDGALSATQV